MEKSKLYTRTGDAGTTSLVGGTRVKKNSVRLEAYGTLDEFSSFLGCVLSEPSCPPSVKEQLLEVQNMMFNFGGYLASEAPEGESPAAWGLTEDHIKARSTDYVGYGIMDGNVVTGKAHALLKEADA